MLQPWILLADVKSGWRSILGHYDSHFTILTNDQIINAYFNLIKDRSSFLDSQRQDPCMFFSQPKRLKMVNHGIFANEIVIIPHNINNRHWTISVIFLKGNFML